MKIRLFISILMVFSVVPKLFTMDFDGIFTDGIFAEYLYGSQSPINIKFLRCCSCMQESLEATKGMLDYIKSEPGLRESLKTLARLEFQRDDILCKNYSNLLKFYKEKKHEEYEFSQADKNFIIQSKDCIEGLKVEIRENKLRIQRLLYDYAERVVAKAISCSAESDSKVGGIIRRKELLGRSDKMILIRDLLRFYDELFSLDCAYVC